MKSKKKILTVATLSAFMALGTVVVAQDTGGDKNKTGVYETGKKPGKTHLRRRHRRHRRHTTKSHKGGKKG